MKRRIFLLSGAGAAGALVVGWGLLPARGRLGSPEDLPAVQGQVALNAWISIGSDGHVGLAMPRSEMGQGVHTALAMLAAEELDLPLTSIRLLPAGTASLYGNVAMLVGGLPFHPSDSQPGGETLRVRSGQWLIGKLARELGIQVTGGSSTVADGFGPIRLAAATARAQLLAAAAKQWQVAATELSTSGGFVRHASSQRHASYAELAGAAAEQSPGSVAPKDRKAWKLIGTPAARVDVFDKTRGQTRFGIDVRPAGLIFAAVLHSPKLGGRIDKVDAKDALQKPGVLQVVNLPSVAGSTEAVAVVGKTTWHAQQGARAVNVQWKAPEGEPANSKAILESLEATARSDGGFTFFAQGDPAGELAKAPTAIEAVYRAPYLAHAAMEPINCTAQVQGGKVTIWASTQSPQMARGLAAQLAGVAPEQVTLHVTHLGGGFGRRLDIDMVGQAVTVALQTQGKPVQVIWSREEDLRHDFYRPASVALLRASLGADGLPAALTIHSAGDAPTPRWMERALVSELPIAGAALASGGDLSVPSALQPALAATAGATMTPDKTAAEGLFDLPYAIANQRMRHAATRSGVPVGFWRSVGHSHHAFFSESFIDELATQAGKDPVAYRLAMLADMPRYATVLRLAAGMAGWGSPLAPGVARGVALHESFGSVVAQVVEASVTDGQIRVLRAVVAIDAGTVVNPGIVAQQMESGVVFGLTAALYGRIDITNGEVEQGNFPSYRLLSLADTPRIETYIVPSEAPPSGVGEPGVPPVAPALANAIFALTGKRLRELPLRLA